MDKQQRIEIGQRLRRRRQELGLTREKMSELADNLPMEYILFGEGEGPGDTSAVLDLLRRCTPRELKLAEEVLKLFLMKQPEGL